MDIYEYLKLDHQHVNQLFEQFEKSELLDRRKQIVFLICQELIIHAHSEQETFYKALKRFEQTQDDALHGLKEHQEMEDQISLVLQSQEFGAPWIKKVEKLKEIVQHHVKDEEGPMFKQAQKVLSKEEAYILKEQMHYLKHYLLLALEKESKASKDSGIQNKKNTSLKKPITKSHEPRTPRFH